ncbi:MAG: OsmC family protein [Planctomycetota bacterium]|jgi:uncharacterized OsmC-like protein
MTGQKILNGINVEQLHGCRDDLKQNPDVGRYKFRAKNEWVDGAHCRTTIRGFWAAGQEDTSRERAHVLEGDEPTTLLGEDHGPNATEALLHALGACLNASFIYHAAVQGVRVDALEFELEGDLHLSGFLGVDESVPSNFQRIRVKCRVKADAPREKLEELCEYAQKRSPVFNTISRPVPVHVRLETADIPAGAHRR